MIRIVCLVFVLVLFISLTGIGEAVSISGPDPFADSVVNVNYGDGAGFGKSGFPDIVLGAPEGAGTVMGSVDVLSLGNGGEIILEFTNNYIYDGDGIDFTIFENPILSGGAEDNVFTETATVAVSDDGFTFVAFPFNYNPAGTGAYVNPANFSGFAGINPVLSNTTNGIDSTDPTVSGGDFFNLSDIAGEALSAGIDLNHISFIKITDTGYSTLDLDGDIVDDAGNYVFSTGFDLDAVAGVNTVLIPEPLTILLFLSGIVSIIKKRRKVC